MKDMRRDHAKLKMLPMIPSVKFAEIEVNASLDHPENRLLRCSHDKDRYMPLPYHT